LCWRWAARPRREAERCFRLEEEERAESLFLLSVNEEKGRKRFTGDRQEIGQGPKICRQAHRGKGGNDGRTWGEEKEELNEF
jgi:hypothetical protein